ncbi:MAG: TOMM precursor leader peptide-binding protein [Candidatus Nanopelagicales bacterium]
MTTHELLRLHPWRPLLTGATGLRVAFDPTPADLPEHLSGPLRAAARGTDHDGVGVRTLQEVGALVDLRHWRALASVHGDAGARAYLSRAARGLDAFDRIERRGSAAVAVSGDDDLSEPLRISLRAAGVPVVDRRGDAVLEIHVGRPSPTTIQRWMGSDTPHLVVVPRPDSVRVGPLVVPGATACLQCLHLSRCDRDRQWPALSEQLRRTTSPQPDPVLMGHASAVAVRGIVQHLETGDSALHSQYWTCDLDALQPLPTQVARHPACGCWWPLVGDHPT